MKPLHHARVLFVGNDPLEESVLPVWLQSEGAELRYSDFAGALEAAQAFTPTVLVADLRVERAQAESQLFQLQADAQLAKLPVVALISDRAAPTLGASASPRVNKYIAAPFHPADVVNALAGLTSVAQRASAPELTREELFRTVVETQLQRRDLRALLGLLNATGPFRYTAVLRLDEDEQLTSMWTFDRDNPDSDGFPADTKVAASYCQRVMETKEPFVMPDAALEPSVQDHAARHTVLSYCGVPVLREDGAVFGTLCQFDVVPRFLQPTTLSRLGEVAGLLQKHLPALWPAHDPG